MRLNPILFLLLKFYAVLWIIFGGICLSFEVVALVQGKLEFTVWTLTVLLGIGLLHRSHTAWEMSLIMASVFLAFHVFLFLLVVTSNNFSTSTAQINWNETVSTEIPGPIFYSAGLCLLAGQVWLLLSKPIRHFFSDKASVEFADNPVTIHDLVLKNKTNKRSGDTSDRQRKSLLRTNLIVICPECKTRVLPQDDGTCPSCQAKIPVKMLQGPN